MKQSGHLNPREETGTGCPVTSKYGRPPPNKHGGVGRQQQQQHMDDAYSRVGCTTALHLPMTISFCLPLIVAFMICSDLYVCVGGSGEVYYLCLLAATFT